MEEERKGSKQARMAVVEEAFIQPPEHRPSSSSQPAKSTESGEEIPTIDLSWPHPSLPPLVHQACRDWGFFQVLNHGLPPSTLNNLKTAARDFFDLPREVKSLVRRDQEAVWGYYDSEHTKNVRDWKEVFDFSLLTPSSLPHPLLEHPPIQTFNRWPPLPSNLRGVCEEYAGEVERLAFRLLGLICESLGLEKDRLDGYFEEQTSFVRLNYYPVCPSPDLALGVGRHKDGGALTVLAQDQVGGLEVRRKKDGQWISVDPTPDAFIVNVGDIIQVWSNERYESVEHRVKVNSEKGRLSIPFFFNPSHTVNVRPLEEMTGEGAPPLYGEYNWGHFFSTRKLSNFMKLDVDNVQIQDFRLHPQSS